MPDPSHSTSSLSRIAARLGVDAAFVVFVSLWLLALCTATAIYLVTGRHIDMCAFRLATGYPCATCGGTRAALCAVKGDLAHAWRYNPLATVLVFLLPLYAMLKVFHVRTPPLPPRARAAAVAIVAILIGLNWWYVATHLPAAERAAVTSPAATP
ncbi:MAG: DUF2752 domain-containing protein [Planctomycetes bacterium]|nr:DUF2752 domain-containing protein [Planctomycetota bacterium]